MQLFFFIVIFVDDDVSEESLLSSKSPDLVREIMNCLSEMLKWDRFLDSQIAEVSRLVS